MFTYLFAENFEFFVENVVRGNSVQIAPNFPAKSLTSVLLFNGKSLD